MKQTILMRFLFCKIHSPFMCFCKPSAAAHLYSNCSPLKFENGAATHFVPSTANYGVSDKSSVNKKHEEADESHVLKSCMRKKKNSSRPVALKEIVKKRVKWIDSLGKELAQIKEFESSETGDTDYEEESRSCLCVIL